MTTRHRIVVWATGLLAVCEVAFAQSMPVTRASMEAAFDAVDSAAQKAIANPPLDVNGNGVWDRDEMGCFGEYYETARLLPEVIAAFNANADIVNAIDGDLEAFVFGFDLFAAYYATIIGDADVGSQHLVDLIEGFSNAVGAGGIDGDPQTDSASDGNGEIFLADAGLDASRADEVDVNVIYGCLLLLTQYVAVTGPSEVLAGLGATYTAVTFDPDDPSYTETHTFTSSNPAVLLHLGGGVFQGVARGTAEVVAEGVHSDVFGAKTVNVRIPEWHETCTIDEEFREQFDDLSGLVDSVAMSINAVLDLDGDGVPDLHQLTALAYTLCEGASAAGPDAASVAQSHAANLATIVAYVVDLETIETWLNGAGVNASGQRDHAEAIFEAYFTGGGFAGATAIAAAIPPLSGAVMSMTSFVETMDPVSGIGPLLEDVHNVAIQHVQLGFNREVIAGWAGLTAEHDVFWQGFTNGISFGLPETLGTFVNGPASYDVPTHTALLDSVAASLAAIEGAIPSGEFATTTACSGGPCDALEALSSMLLPDAIDDNAEFAPTMTDPDFEVFPSSSKAPGDSAYAGASVFAPGVNPFDITNALAYAAVLSRGGDEYDFVGLITGQNLYAPGSPFVPAAGALALGIVVGGIVIVAVRRLRRG